MDSKYDYIVIGGGTSGLVVASRLTEDSNTNVLVLEAGDDHSAHPQVQTPGFWPANIGSPDRDWSYTTVPQASINENEMMLDPPGHANIYLERARR